MSEYITNLEKPISQYEVLPRLKTAHEYLNIVSFNVDRFKKVELVIGDNVGIIGNSTLTNLILRRICISSLLPKKYGGFGAKNFCQNVFILDGGNSTDVYQCVDFLKQCGLNIRKALQRIIVSRVFTIYQLTHSLVYDLPKLIKKYNVNVVAITDLLHMFEDPHLNVKETEYLIRKIVDALSKINIKHDILLLASIPLRNDLPSSILDMWYEIVDTFNKRIEIVENKTKTNSRLRMKVCERQYIHDVTTRKICSLSLEDLLTMHEVGK